jgi:hypothetical protein
VGDGVERYETLAREAADLLYQLRPMTPLVPPLNAILDGFPDPFEIVMPKTDAEGKPLLDAECQRTVHHPTGVLLPCRSEWSWSRYLLMLGWKGIPTKVERWSWSRGVLNSKVEYALLENRALRGPGPIPGDDLEYPPVRLASLMRSVFRRSVAALAWIADNATRTGLESASHAPEATRGHDKIVETPDAIEHRPNTALPKSLDSQAVGLAYEMLTEQQSINVSEIARRLGVERTSLYDLPAFSAMVEKDRASREAAKQRRPKGTKDRKTRTLEAWRDED